MMTKKVSYFSQLQGKETHSLISCPIIRLSSQLPYFSVLVWQIGVGLWFRQWWSRTTIMTVRSDGCTRRHMSVLRSSDVRLKLLLCVNKEDRKWQFGSSNQECHSQLRPLPAPDTSHGRRGHGSDSSFSLYSFSPLFCLFYRTFHFNTTYKMHNSQGEDNDVRKTRARATASHFLNGPIKHEACPVRLPWHPVSKFLPCLFGSREADVLSLPSSSGQSCQDLLVKDTEDSPDGKNELSEV